MDTLYTFVGALCLAEGVCLFIGKDSLVLMDSTKKEDYNLDKVLQVGKWISLVGIAYSLGVDMNRLSDVAENILLVIFGVTLAAHVYVFKSKRFRREDK